MEPILSKKDLFKSNPLVDPHTGESIEIESNEYTKLVKKYGEPNKIKSPKSQKLISIGKGEYNKLKTEGYTDDQLIYQSKKSVPMTNENLIYINNIGYTISDLTTMVNYYNKMVVNPYINDDILIAIMMKSDLEEINKLCRLNKLSQQLCQNQILWKTKYLQDFEQPEKEIVDWKEEYKNSYINVIITKFNKNTIKIIGVPIDLYEKIEKIFNRYGVIKNIKTQGLYIFYITFKDSRDLDDILSAKDRVVRQLKDIKNKPVIITTKQPRKNTFINFELEGHIIRVEGLEGQFTIKQIENIFDCYGFIKSVVQDNDDYLVEYEDDDAHAVVMESKYKKKLITQLKKL